jgi:hypothetical protein
MMRVVYTAGRVHFLGQWLVAAFEAGRTLPSDSSGSCRALMKTTKTNKPTK